MPRNNAVPANADEVHAEALRRMNEPEFRAFADYEQHVIEYFESAAPVARDARFFYREARRCVRYELNGQMQKDAAEDLRYVCPN